MPLAPVPATRVPRSALTFSSAGDLGVRIGRRRRDGRVRAGHAWSRTSRASCGSAAFADGARVIVQGQDFVREGQKVEAVMAAELTATRGDWTTHR